MELTQRNKECTRSASLSFAFALYPFPLHSSRFSVSSDAAHQDFQNNEVGECGRDDEELHILNRIQYSFFSTILSLIISTCHK